MLNVIILFVIELCPVLVLLHGHHGVRQHSGDLVRCSLTSAEHIGRRCREAGAFWRLQILCLQKGELQLVGRLFFVLLGLDDDRARLLLYRLRSRFLEPNLILFLGQVAALHLLLHLSVLSLIHNVVEC